MRLLAPTPPPGTAPGPRPRFSVVVAAYQAEQTLAEAVASALSQDEPPLEVVVVDDGSTDGTGGVLAELVRTSAGRVRGLHQANAGEAAARNAAVRAARGEWVVVLDADDRFLPGRLRALADAVEARPDLDVITTDAWHEIDGRRADRVYRASFAFPVEDQRRALLHRNLVFGLAAVRRARLLEVGGYDEQVAVSTDWACWLRMVLTGSRFGCIDEPLAIYRVASSSLSGGQLGLLRGRVRTLDRTADLPFLTAEDRRELAASTAAARVELELAEARHALLASAPDRRRLAVRVARSSRHAPASRIKALWAAAAPGAAARRLGTLEAQGRRAEAFRPEGQN